MEFLSAVGTQWLAMLDFPAVVLGLIFILGIWVLWQTQKDPKNNFDFTDMLRDENGKPSAYRLAIFVCLAVSTWAIMYMVIATEGKLDTWIFVWYIAIWSGAKVAEKAIEAYMGRSQRERGDEYYTSSRPSYRSPSRYDSPVDLYSGGPSGGLNQQFPGDDFREPQDDLRRPYP
jgi:hypothetical protein